eukprot:408750-Rhodomonas_salina.1
MGPKVPKLATLPGTWFVSCRFSSSGSGWQVQVSCEIIWGAGGVGTGWQNPNFRKFAGMAQTSLTAKAPPSAPGVGRRSKANDRKANSFDLGQVPSWVLSERHHRKHAKWFSPQHGPTHLDFNAGEGRPKSVASYAPANFHTLVNPNPFTSTKGIINREFRVHGAPPEQHRITKAREDEMMIRAARTPQSSSEFSWMHRDESGTSPFQEWRSTQQLAHSLYDSPRSSCVFANRSRFLTEMYSAARNHDDERGVFQPFKE